jgi:uncharacterized protein YjfI (DUF2170 family)
MFQTIYCYRNVSPSRDVVAGIVASQRLMPISRLLLVSLVDKNEAYFTLGDLVVTLVCNTIGRPQK